MIAPIFELVQTPAGDQLRARLPFLADGGFRQPDGVQFFSLEQAAKRSGQSIDELRAEWISTFGDVIDSTESVLAPEETPAPTLDVSAGNAAIAVDPARANAFKLVQAARMQVLRRVIYPHFTDDEFELFTEICRQRRLNPFCGQLIGKIQKRRGPQGEDLR